MAKKRKTKYTDSNIFSEYSMTYRPAEEKSAPAQPAIDPKKNVLFDMIDSIFTDRYAYTKYTKECIKQNAFMINRIMSIQFPEAAAMLDKPNLNPYAMYYLWNKMLYNGRKRELWVYTKGSKKSKEETSDDKPFSENVIDQYCEYNNIERKQFDDAFRFFREELIGDVNAYLEHIKSLDNL